MVGVAFICCTFVAKIKYHETFNFWEKNRTLFCHLLFLKSVQNWNPLSCFETKMHGELLLL